MARPLLRPAPIYWRGKKVAEAREGSYEIDSNDQREIGQEGYIGHTDGATISSAQFTLIVPVPGLSINMLPSMLNKQYVKVGILTDGKMHNLEGRMVKIAYSFSYEKGENRCVGSFEAGEPDLA